MAYAYVFVTNFLIVSYLYFLIWDAFERAYTSPDICNEAPVLLCFLCQNNSAIWAEILSNQHTHRVDFGRP